MFGGGMGIGPMMATNLSFGSVGSGFAAKEGSMALANMAGPDMSQGDILSLHAQDKAFALQAAKADIGSQVADVSQDAHQRNKRLAVQQREYRVQQGWLA